MTTISDVASTAGVSIATVSRVLNNNPRVDPQLTAKVRAAIAALGYQPSSIARSLSTQRTHVWALIISDISNPFFPEIVRGVENVARSAGYSLVLCNAEEDSETEASYFNLAVAEQARGVILVPTNSNADLSALIRRNVPVVTADRRLNSHDVDCVLVDNVRGAKQAVGHLFEHGYRRIACITGPMESTTGAERYAGYRLAHAEAGAPLEDSLLQTGSFSEGTGYAAMQRLLSLRKKPDAVFTANNLMTIGALHAIDEAKLVVPDDLGIVGFDDMSWASLVRPPLTSVAQPSYELGTETARLLLSRIDGYLGPPRTVMLSPQLVVRQSSTPKVLR
ncbi:MAG: LacI family DNA-binding transcriptional regulator [Acidimicrobiales bacterium]